MTAWTDEATQDLRRMRVTERLSFLECSKQISARHFLVTRNACIGRATRCGMEGATFSESYTKLPRKRPKRATTRSQRPAKRLNFNPVTKVMRINEQSHTLDMVQEMSCDLPPDESPYAVSLVEAKEHQCRWPLGDPRTPAFRFCGADKECEPYCARHAQMAYARDRPQITERRRLEMAERGRRLLGAFARPGGSAAAEFEGGTVIEDAIS